ncbi:hypothetical protein GCM10010435_74360 [Winogradskya consettensis]|uniref:Uncharacterized protein n=1 Tax=Winogradskya consettensis TaxID=113560 RepID=A0A919SQK0_9ACTN|nr:hypothetical protein Aco04nite_43220 [Actinoplanes consettensis]
MRETKVREAAAKPLSPGALLAAEAEAVVMSGLHRAVGARDQRQVCLKPRVPESYFGRVTPPSQSSGVSRSSRVPQVGAATRVGRV